MSVWCVGQQHCGISVLIRSFIVDCLKDKIAHKRPKLAKRAGFLFNRDNARLAKKVKSTSEVLLDKVEKSFKYCVYL